MGLRKAAAFLTAAMLLCFLAGCSGNGGAAASDGASPVAGKKVAYIMQMAPS